MKMERILKDDHCLRAAVAASLLLSGFLLAALPAAAQYFPGRPVRFIVPIAPGGGGDITTRAVAQKLAALWGQNVVVDNRPGGTGAIGLEIAANARPDGYTVSLVTGTHAARQAIQGKKLPYDLVRGFSHVTQVTAQSYVLVVNPAVPAKTIPELVAYSNTQPNGLTFGSSGQGSLQHLSGALLSTLGKAKLLHVPYKGGGPALADVLAGQINMIFATPLESAPHIQSGRLRALAVSGTTRMKTMAALPTVAEAGVPGFEVSQWYGVLAPAGVPKPVLAQLNRGFVQVLKSPDLVERFAKDSVDLVGSTSEQFRAHVTAEIRRYQRAITAAGIKLE
jgi:tripartite-type tricarboxylate transporter receptor subunit TctC